MRLTKILRTSGLAAIAAGMAFAAVPDEASAAERPHGNWSQNSGNGDHGRRSQSSDNSSARASWRNENRPARPVPERREPPAARQAPSRPTPQRATPQRPTPQMRQSDANRDRGNRDWNSRDRQPPVSRNQNYDNAERNRSYSDSRRNGSYTSRSGADWRRDNDRRDNDRRYDNDRRKDQRYDNNRSRYMDKRFNNGGSRSYDRDRDRDHRQWDRRWRDNHRYNWRDYRTRHHNIYRIGRYYSPYRSYSYRRLSIGFYLDSLFYSNRYWISDPWYYRLPPVDGPYRWVRYYDDVLLVDIYSGEVVDVIHDFFW